MDKRLDNKLVVLVGGNGFVGRHLAQDLLALGARLRIAARNPGKALSIKRWRTWASCSSPRAM